jgi:5-(carboxyamino)imidazole ribonucleotide synthase
VWKISEGGYDGFGVKIIENEKDTLDLPEGECIAESLVDIEKEIGIVLARDKNGEIRVFPPVEMEFHDNANQVEFVICPSDISEEISNKCVDLAISVAESIGANGLLAVELFISKKRGNIRQ